MKIKKVLNNNAVISVNDKGQEIIITGLGIAFKKKTGDDIEEDKVERIFKVAGEEISSDIQKLADAIPKEFLDISIEILEFASISLGTKLSEGTYITLADHICFACQRAKTGLEIKSPLAWEIKQYYNDEYKIGKHALNIIEKGTGIRLPKDEAAAIALHIVNARAEESMPKIVKIISILQDSLNIIKYHFNVEFEDDSISYQRMVTHLKFFAQRIVTEKSLKDDSEELFNIIKLQYAESFECASKIKKYAKDEYGFNVSNSEMTFLTVHIERVVNNSEK